MALRTASPAPFRGSNGLGAQGGAPAAVGQYLRRAGGLCPAADRAWHRDRGGYESKRSPVTHWSFAGVCYWGGGGEAVSKRSPWEWFAVPRCQATAGPQTGWHRGLDGSPPSPPGNRKDVLLTGPWEKLTVPAAFVLLGKNDVLWLGKGTRAVQLPAQY